MSHSEVLMAENNLKLDFNATFPTEREAEIAYEVLRVDKEPSRSQSSKALSLEKNILHVCFNAPTAHQLRTAVNGFLDYLLLVCETMVGFGPPVSLEYSHYN